MKATEFDRAWRLALSPADLTDADDSPLHGCGLPDFSPVRVPIEAVAKLLRWQAVYIGRGEGQPKYDGDELENMRKILVYPSRRVEIIPTTITCPHCGEHVNLSTQN